MPLFRKAKPKLTIPRLFKDGSNGAWFDPSDLWGGSQRLVRRNLLTYSGDFSNAAWTKTGTTAVNTLVTATATSAYHTLGRTATASSSTGSIVASVEAKKGTHRYVLVDVNNGATDYAAFVVDLDTATVTKTQYSNFSQVTAPSVTDIGSGWFRLSFGVMTTLDIAFTMQMVTSATPTISTYGLQSAWTASGTETIELRNCQVAKSSNTDQTYQAVTDWTTEQYAYAAQTQYPWLRRNRFLNTATLSTQTVSSVTANPITVSFKGTGTITFSTAYAGSLAGTGASNKVSLTFTPSAGNLVCTVSGTITEAQCEVGSTATTYQPIGASWDAQYAADESAAGHVPVLFQDRSGTNPCNDAGQTVGVILDRHITPVARRNIYVSYSNDFSGFTKRGSATATANYAVAPDGTTTATRLTGLDAAGVGDVYKNSMLWQTFSLNLALTTSIYIKRVSTSGALVIGNAVNANYGKFTIDLSAIGDGWVRVQSGIPGVTTNSQFNTYNSGQVGLQFSCTSGAPIEVLAWGVQFEISSTPSEYQAVGATWFNGALPLGNHATAATDANRPLLKQDGNGNWYTQGDGVDDALVAQFTTNQGTACAEYVSGASSSTETTGITINTTRSIHSQTTNYQTVIKTATVPESNRTKLLKILDGKAGR